ncbi:MAG: hypothetical protein KC493_14310 [Bacteriovoracaceae bacterium]|nr:hypothetical protein [Bacteriovoracaceae bacterium]
MKLLKVLIFSILLSSCSSIENEKSFNDHLAKQDCEKALIENKTSASMKIVSKAAQGTGTAASYLLTGLGYTTDIIVRFGGGIGLGIIICSPLIAIEIGGKGNGDASARCITEVGGTIIEGGDFMQLGPSSHKGTKSWRCPNLDNLSIGFRKVAQCYYDRGEIQKSHRQLVNIKTDTKFYECLSSKEQSRVLKDLNFYSR